MSEFGTLALVLSGGNALGAYQAGAYQALEEAGLEPDEVAGASAGAINGALICGNPQGRRLERLAAFWRPSGTDEGLALAGMQEDARRTAAAGLTLATGRADTFVPRSLWERWWASNGPAEAASLYDTRPLAATLERLVDFDLLNAGRPRFAATALDVESGEDVVFDTARHRITADHLRASAAMIPAFPPVEVEGRLLADAGLSANLPLDAVLSRPVAGRLLCITLDLLPLGAPRPRSLGAATERMQDLVFASQTRRAFAAWQAIFDERAARGGSAVPAITVLRLAYADQAREVSGKAFDFSPRSVRGRWDAGYRDMTDALAQVRAGGIATEQPGLAVYRAERPSPDAPAVLRRVHESLSPAHA